METVLLGNSLVDVLIDFLVVLYGDEVVDVEVSDMLAMGTGTDLLEGAFYFLVDNYEEGADVVQFLELWVVVVEDRPEL